MKRFIVGLARVLACIAIAVYLFVLIVADDTAVLLIGMVPIAICTVIIWCRECA